MSERLTEMHRILKTTGSIYLHVDHHAVHYLKVEMDKIFGMKNFRTQITWKRSQPKGSAKTFGNNSDYILYYTKSNNLIFNIEYGKYIESNLKRYKFNDHNGKGLYREVSITDPREGYKYDLGYGEKQPSNGYRWKKETMLRRIEEGLVVISHGKVPWQKKYLSDMKGVPVDNIWIDIKNVTGKESKRYPTQKPEALLKRIIKVSSNPGNIVFDPFCGSGTSLVVAKKLGRKWIGIDNNKNAIELTEKRLYGGLNGYE